MALIDGDSVLWSDRALANNRASEVCLSMLAQAEEAGFGVWKAAELFAADIGPGSFTGVRVGVMLAKTFAYCFGAKVSGADAFDLISLTRDVALPSKRGEYFVRPAHGEPFRTSDADLPLLVGYGPDFADPKPPTAAGFASMVGRLVPQDPLLFAPEYLIEPSISIPKKPFRHV